MRKNKMMAAAFAVMMSVSMVVPTVAAESPVKAATSQARSGSDLVDVSGTISPDKGQIKGTLHKEINAYFYKLNLTSGGQLRIVGKTEGSIRIDIVDTDENRICGIRHDYEDTYEHKFELAKGNYYVKVYGKEGAAYQINTYFTKAPYTFAENSNDTILKANSIQLNQVIKGHTAENNEYDYYKINLPAKGDYPLIFDSDDRGRIRWVLYDSNYQEMTGSYGYGSGNHTLSVEHAGTYYIRFSKVVDKNSNYWFKVVGKTPAKTTPVKVTAPKATYITKLTKGSKRFKVSVKKQSATGYQVQYSLKSNFKGSKTKSFKGTSYTVKGLKGKKKYYVRVRSYKKSGSKTLYSAWSGKKSVKTKK